MQLLSLAALVLPAYVCAQYGFDPSSQPSTTAPPVSLPSGTHQVMLGEGDAFTFTPNTMGNVKQGDVVIFTVSSQSSVSHGVVESNPDSPCAQLSGGYDSGLMPPGASSAIVVNTTNPISFFCPQTKPAVHCEMAMVMIINPASSSDITSLMSAASHVTSEATASATMVQSSGSGIEGTSVPTAISSSSSSSSSSSGSSGNTSGAPKGSVATTAGFLTAVFGLFFTMA